MSNKMMTMLTWMTVSDSIYKCSPLPFPYPQPPRWKSLMLAGPAGVSLEPNDATESGDSDSDMELAIQS